MEDALGGFHALAPLIREDEPRRERKGTPINLAYLRCTVLGREWHVSTVRGRRRYVGDWGLNGHLRTSQFGSV